MRAKVFFNVLQDLIEILPRASRSDWEAPHRLHPERPTVVLISGFGATRRALSVMRRRLLRDGFNVIVWSLDWQALSDSVHGYYRLAEKLSSVVLHARKEKGMSRSPFYLVAHSAGGLVARYYVQLLGGSHYCEKLVLLGTPNRGVWKACFGLITHLVMNARCLLQLLPISPFLKRLNDAAYPIGFSIVSIASSDDLVCPPSVTWLPARYFESWGAAAVEVKGLSHSGFLLSKRGYRLLLSHLRPEVLASTEVDATRDDIVP